MSAREQTIARLYGLLELQKKVEELFGISGYNVFVFGSYVTTGYTEGQSDIDIAIYAEDFNLYKRLSLYLEAFFYAQGTKSDIFFIDTTTAAPFYCAPLKSQIQFTDYFPEKLIAFQKCCQEKLNEARERTAT